MAGRKPLLRIGSDVTEARRGIQQVKEDARDLSRVRAEARVQIQTDAAQARLDILNERLARYGQQEQTATVKIASGRAAAEIDRIEARLDKLGRKDVHVTVKVRESALSRLSGAGGGIPLIGGLVGGAASAIGGIAGAAGSAASGAAGLVTSASSAVPAVASLGASAAVAVPLVVLLGGALVALAGAAIAVVASLAAAAGAVVGLGVAFGAALVPIGALVIPAIATITRLFGALKTNAQGQRAAADGVKTAQDGVAQATQGVADAQQNLAAQAVPALQAMQDAAERVKDAILGVKDAQLGVQDASLSFRQAKFDLAQFRQEAGLTGKSFDDAFKKFTDVSFRPTASGIKQALGGNLDTGQELQLERLILAVKHARLGQQQATDKVHDSTVELSRAQQANNQYLRQGIAAYPGYQAAVKGVTQAEQARKRAVDQLNRAQDASQRGTEKLGAADQARLPALKAIVDTLERAFNPAINAVLDGIFKGAKAFAQVFTDPRLRAALLGLGQAIGDVFVKLGQTFNTPAWRNAFVQITRGATHLVRILGGDAFVSFLTIIRKLAVAFMPLLVQASRELAGWLGHIARATPREFAHVARSLYQSFKDWFGVAKSLVGLLGSFFPSAQKAGDHIARGISHIVDRWTAWIKANPSAIKTFFRDVIGFARNLKSVLDDIVSALGTIKDTIGVLGDAAVPTGKDGPLSKFTPQQIAGGTKGITTTPVAPRPSVTFQQLRENVAAGISNLRANPRGQAHEAARRALKAAFEALYGAARGAALFAAGGYSTGGLVGGAGRGDTVPAWLEPGEFVVRRAVVQAIGLPNLARINAGGTPALATAGARTGVGHQENHFHITTPTGDLPDGRFLGAQLRRELERIGRG